MKKGASCLYRLLRPTKYTSRLLAFGRRVQRFLILNRLVGLWKRHSNSIPGLSQGAGEVVGLRYSNRKGLNYCIESRWRWPERSISSMSGWLSSNALTLPIAFLPPFSPWPPYIATIGAEWSQKGTSLGVLSDVTYGSTFSLNVLFLHLGQKWLESTFPWKHMYPLG